MSSGPIARTTMGAAVCAVALAGCLPDPSDVACGASARCSGGQAGGAGAGGGAGGGGAGGGGAGGSGGGAGGMAGGGGGGGLDAAADPPEDSSGSCTGTGTRTCYTGPAGTDGVGPCKAGMQTCAGGSWGPCVGQVEPVGEVACNGIDDDCDGHTDAFTVTCPGTGVCVTDSTCSSGATCTCGAGMAAVSCTGYQTCSTVAGGCKFPSWLCVACPSCAYPRCNLGVDCGGGSLCPWGASCGAGGTCTCASGLHRNCDGTPCSGTSCAAGWYCG